MEREELCDELERKRARMARQAKNFAFKMEREELCDELERKRARRARQGVGVTLAWRVSNAALLLIIRAK